MILLHLQNLSLFRSSRICFFFLLTGMLIAPLGKLGGQPWSRAMRFSTSDGLPSNHVNKIVSDAEGFIWVGTSNGLARFDGQQLMALDVVHPGAITPKTSVDPIVADSRHNLWLSTKEHLYRISLITYQTQVYPHPYSYACTDRKGDLWFATPEGLARYKPASDDFEQFKLMIEQKAVAVREVHRGRGDILLVNSIQGLFRFDTQKKQYEPLSALTRYADKLLVTAADEQGLWWVSVWYDQEQGLLHYDPYRDAVIRSFNSTYPGLASTDINSILPDGDQIWLATNSEGLLRYSVSENRFFSLAMEDANAQAVLSKQISRVHRAPSGQLWVSTPFALFQFPAGAKNAELLAHHPYIANSLVSTFGTAVLALPGRRMVFGTWQGLSIYDRDTKTFSNIHFPLYNDNVYNDQIIGLARHGNEGFWASTWSGLYQLDSRTGRILEYYITHSNAGNQHPKALMRQGVGALRRLYEDRDGVLWGAGFSNRLWKISGPGPSRTFTPLDTLVPDANMLNDRAESFLDLDERFVLIGTLDGLVRYDRRTTKFQAIQAVFPGIVEPAYITSMALSKNGEVLLLANGRPFRLRLSDASATATPLNQGYDEAEGDHIIEDDQGAAWMSTSGGLIRFAPENGAVTYFDTRYYFQDNVLAMRPSVAPAKDSDGNLYLGGIRGVSFFNPADFANSKLPAPTVKIVSLRVNDHPLSTDTVIHLKKILRLPYRQNNLAFDFSALPSAVPALNRFAYRINAGNWTDLGASRSVNFSQLAPGKYRFEVKAANSDGVWTPTPAFLTVVIRPPWWRTGAAIAMYFLLTVAAVYAFYRFQLRQKFALREAEQLRELDAFKTRFFTNITHEFRTPLTVILGAGEQLRKTAPGPGQHYEGDWEGKLNLIRRNGENLLRLINQILDLAKVEAKALQLNLQQGDVLAYLRYITESLHSFAQMKEVSVRVESSEAAIVMDYDPERLLHIVYNLLSNAIKFTPAGGEVVLRADLTNFQNLSNLRLTVSDTGMGISEEDLPYVFDRFFQTKNSERFQTGGTGIGLALTKELVKLLGGDITVESRLGQGAVFTVLLPITHQAALAEERIGEQQAGASQVHFPANASAPPAADLPQLLLIEDNPDIVAYLADLLGVEYHLHFAFNGRQGIEKALETVPDLILSDVMMPEKDGLEVCDALKNDERSSHIPIVLLTAKADVESRLAGLRRGADAYLSKPFHQEELSMTLFNLLEQRRKWQERFGGMTQAAPADAATAPQALDQDERVEFAFLEKIGTQVEQHLDDPEFNGPRLAKAMLLSEVQLYRKIKALTGKSTAIYIRSIRLQKGLELLRSTTLSVSEIAYSVGFKDIHYFTRTFTKEFGAAPSEMRK
jgi:signal transduction histidine kinase/DNA-binding response OmpR family regulator/streptogramin lyase